MMARHVMLAWYMCSFEIFYGIWTSIDKKNYIFVIFQGGPDPLSPPSGSAQDYTASISKLNCVHI